MLLLFGGLLLPYVRVNRTRAPKCRIFRPLVHFVCNCVLIWIKLWPAAAQTPRIPFFLVKETTELLWSMPNTSDSVGKKRRGFKYPSVIAHVAP